MSLTGCFQQTITYASHDEKGRCDACHVPKLVHASRNFGILSISIPLFSLAQGGGRYLVDNHNTQKNVSGDTG